VYFYFHPLPAAAQGDTFDRSHVAEVTPHTKSHMPIGWNEVICRIELEPASVKKWMRDPSQFTPLVAGAGQDTDGTPRNTTLLCDVAYWIDAYPLVFDTSGDNTPTKYVEMMSRRVEKGQCFHRPYLGCREFAAEFGPPRAEDRPVSDSINIGRMLYDVVFRPDGNHAAFFDARLENGVLETRPDVVLRDNARREEVLACSCRP